MALSDVYRASCIFTAPNADGPMVVTLHYRTVEVNTVLTPVEEAQEIADEVVDTIETLYIPILADSTTFDSVNVIGITDPTVQASATSATLGDVVEGSVSYRNTVISRNITGKRGRTFTGYQQWMAPTEGQQSNGALGASFLADMATFVLGLKRLSQQPSTNKYDQTVYSRLLNANTLVSTFIVRPNTGTNKQRQLTTG